MKKCYIKLKNKDNSLFFYLNIWYNKYMRKKSFRILSIFLCLTMFFLAGCTGGLGFDGGDGDYASGFQPRQVDGVKAMMKPADYSIAEAVGENSEYFYNLFAGRTIEYLFNSYFDLFNTYNTINETTEVQDTIFQNTDLLTNNIQVDGSVVEDDNKQYYYFDSIRYSIQSITINQDDSGNPISAEVVLNLDDGWNFSIQNFDQFILGVVAGRDIGGLDEDYYSIITNNNIVNISFNENFFAYYYNPVEAFGTPGDYGDFYYGDLIMKDETLPNYFDSAYYQQNVAESAVTAFNAYQEVLEYATYLFVLGYDYVNADGSVNADGAPFFDFQVSYATQSVNIDGVDMMVSVPQITVGGWGSGYISITEALARVKRMYEQFGTYIGLTTDEETGNLAQLKRFILDYFVGLDKNPDGTYNSTSTMTVTTRQQLGSAYDEISNVKYTLDREYETVVENILNYACEQVRIGNAEDGTPVQIDTAYPISQIVDFEGDYFAASFTDENGESDDSDPLRHIAEAEYQNLSFTILDEDVGANFSELVLIFQYYDTGTTDRDLEYLDELTINVGFNYYDSSSGVLYDVGSIKKTIKNQIAMSDTDYSAGVDPDENWVIFTVSDAIAESDKVKKVEPFEMKMKFDNNIGGGDLNATEGEEIDGSGYAKAITITGSSKAREYYQMNDSSTYGRYATFNPNMFYGKSDYIEVYFDVEKEEGRENVNYNFKVGLFGLFSDEYMN